MYASMAVRHCRPARTRWATALISDDSKVPALTQTCQVMVQKFVGINMARLAVLYMSVPRPSPGRVRFAFQRVYTQPWVLMFLIWHEWGHQMGTSDAYACRFPYTARSTSSQAAGSAARACHLRAVQCIARSFGTPRSLTVQHVSKLTS
jgi:hypothetical protein